MSLSVVTCREHNCPYLVDKESESTWRGAMYKFPTGPSICRLTGKMPRYMETCPKVKA